MRKLALLAAATFAASSTPVFATADVNPPTLHGFCSVASPCPDLGSNSPTNVNPPQFGFATSGAADSGSLFIYILTPNNLGIPGPFTFTGYLNGTATLFDANGPAPGTPAWTSGQLDAYLGIPQGPPPEASPANPIGAFLPATQGCGPKQGCDPGATGYYVFQAIIPGTTTLPGNSGTADSYLSTLGQGLAQGSYIVAFLQQTDDYGATANSGAILEDAPPLPEPGTWALMLVGFGAAGVAMRRSRRKQALLTQLA